MDDLRVAHELLSTSIGTGDGTQELAANRAAVLLNGREELLRTSSSGEILARTMSLVELVLRFRGSEMTDPRDRIYALLSLANDADMVNVNYNKSVLQVFAGFVSTYIERQGLLDLILIPSAPVKRSRNPHSRRLAAFCEDPDTPSWLAPMDELPLGSPEGRGQARRSWNARINGERRRGLKCPKSAV